MREYARMEGTDGNMWIVIANKNGVLAWRRE